MSCIVPTCCLLTPDGRVTISDRTLIVTASGERTETVLADDGELAETYRSAFGLSQMCKD